MVVLLTGLCAVLSATVSNAAEAPVGLGTAGSFAVLAGSGVTNTGPTIVSGDLGTCPTPTITGFPPGVVTGAVHPGDAVCVQAKSDLTAAYIDAAGRTPTVTYPGVKDLGGETLTPGVYRADSFAITGTLTLDAQGDPNAVFIFQAGSTLITAPNSRVVLINGAQPCNVFWQVGSSATLGVGSTFVGTILALTSITANTDADVQGRLLARNGATTLDSNNVSTPACAPATTTSSSTTSTTVVPTTTSTTVVPTTTSTTLVSTTTSTTLVSTTSTAVITVPPTTAPPVTMPPVTTTLGGGPIPGTTTSTSSTTPPSTTTSTTSTVGPGLATTTPSTVSVLSAAGKTGTLARTGSSVRWGQFWAGTALALGGLLVLVAREDVSVRRRP
ncbi:MAG: DUF3494 domain-containing protein [Actinobacteria bacterium]|nr:DUF3494 domain-containing protein [Actinomycetota bacterium]